jgi:ribose 5-phosphate isomerase B
MKISLGSDHAGVELKAKIKEVLGQEGAEIHDQGTFSGESVDYPDFARKVAVEVAHKQADYGILICGTGIGMSIAANKVAGVRAAKIATEEEARLSREHNDANVLALGARILDEETALRIVHTWLQTPFAGGRHQRRIDKVTDIERAELPTGSKQSATR